MYVVYEYFWFFWHSLATNIDISILQCESSLFYYIVERTRYPLRQRSQIRDEKRPSNVVDQSEAELAVLVMF